MVSGESAHADARLFAMAAESVSYDDAAYDGLCGRTNVVSSPSA